MKTFLIVLISVALSIAATAIFLKRDSVSSGENAYERVMRTGVLRCGYVDAPPSFFIDPTTGELSGISYEAVNEMGKNLGLKVEWTEETGWGTMLQSLADGRFDALCSAVWATTTRARMADFVDPMFYADVVAWARPDDPRFKNGLHRIDKNVKFAVIDGHISDILHKAKFPDNPVYALPQNSSIPEAFIAVAGGKADITFEQTYVGQEFLAENPGKLVDITNHTPLKFFPPCVLVAKGETGLRDMLNTAQAELMNSGRMNELVAKYEKYPGALFRVANPYETDSP